MRTRNFITSVGLAVAAVVLLSACGSDNHVAVSCESDPYQLACQTPAPVPCESDPYQAGCGDACDTFFQEGCPEPKGEIHVTVGRTNSDLSSFSLECYTFYESGDVELRHGGLPDVNDSGYFSSEDGLNGEIEWTSGRVASSVASDGTSYRIDGAQGSVISSCLQ
jgi:hypothetical protein